MAEGDGIIGRVSYTLRARTGHPHRLTFTRCRATVLHHIVASSLAGYKAEADRKLASQKSKIDLTLKAKVESAKDPWVRSGHLALLI